MPRILRLPILLALVAALCAALVPAAASAAEQKSSTVKLSRGATTVTLDAATAATLTGTGAGQLGLSLGVLQPARAHLPRLSFPITNGRVKVGGRPLALQSGRIAHTGGISLSKGGTTLTLRNFVIDLDRGVLTANAGGTRVPILALGGDDIALHVTGRRVRVTGVELTFTSQAIGALNATFGTALPTDAKIPFGTAVVETRIPGR